MAGPRLPVIGNPETIQSSLDAQGKRHFVHPADVKGRFATARRILFGVLIAIWIALPTIRVGGAPLVLLDVGNRRFHLFGAVFNSQDIYLLFFLLTGIGFSLALATSLLGRVFCGYACPQTVFLESFFRPIERLVEGPRAARLRLRDAPWTAEKIGKKALKHALYLLAAFVTAHIFIGFFVPLPKVVAMVMSRPSNHPEVFVWAVAVTLLVYGNFAFAREQVCLVVCPYGRLQSMLVDDDSLVIGYDKKRGEPRGKVGHSGAGDCIDCKRCVVVCPTGIDIRNGLQLDCVGCSACVDACDEMMDKVSRPRGLVRYDSQRGLSGGQRRIWRPRLLIYAVLGAIGLIVFTVVALRRTSFEATLLRNPGMPFVVQDDTVRNSFTVHLVNKSNADQSIQLDAKGDGLVFEPASTTVSLAPQADAKIIILVSAPRGTSDRAFWIDVQQQAERTQLSGRFVGPKQ